jgi:bifunctional UDP-N-acetylglucosamine pyrophosphorylase / glucosamine-1-phosphate N-acetyltransferase
MDKDLAVIILAAGQGRRMHSQLPKVLHTLGERSLLAHVIDVANQLLPKDLYVVYGYGGETVKERFNDQTLHWCLQAEQLGTGHAVLKALPQIDDDWTVLVLYGDVPLITKPTLEQLIQLLGSNALALLSVVMDNPQGYGRLIRDGNDAVCRIVEDCDAKGSERTIREVNTGIMAAKARDFKRWLSLLRNNNVQGEYYLTDCIAAAVNQGLSIGVLVCQDPSEVWGVNNKSQLAECERVYQRRQAGILLDQGVTLRDPARLDIRGRVVAGRDVVIDVNVVLEGDVEIGDDVVIGPNCLIRDSKLGSGTRVKANCIVEETAIGEKCQIGPFSRIRPGASLANEVHLGNFVEVKKSTIGEMTKINHLSYVGDSEVGKRVNIGAGTITCNYDGAYKHITRIGDDAFIGSDTQLIAPVTVGQGATIGAGSTIVRNAPDQQLTLSRVDQVTIKGWRKPKKVRN